MHSKSLYIALTSVILAGCIASTLQDTRPDTSPSAHLPTLDQIEIDGKKFHIGKIDTSYNQLKIVENSPAPNSKSIKEIHIENNSTMSFNGSFFSPDFKPLGLLISESKLIFPAQKSSLMDGIFIINNKGQPQVLEYDKFQKQQETLLPNIDFAIQSGPILINQKGQIIADKKNTKKAGRTALALSKNNEIIVIILRQSLLDRENSLTLYDFAQLISNSPKLSDLELHSVINLDGGNSSGIATKNNYSPELEKVQNIIITVPRNNIE
jgi:uncharacterized protein YigE (DUF2233 family)